MSREHRPLFTYNKVILRDPDQFHFRMGELESSLEEHFKRTHPAYCWNYPTALGWLEIQYDEVLASFREDPTHSETLCEYADGYMADMIVRVAHRIADSRSRRRLPPA